MAFMDASEAAIEIAIVRLWSLNRRFEKFCRCPLKKIPIPTTINIFALNIAWVRRWKKHKCVNPSPSVMIISPSCLIVESAIVSLMSFLVMAQDAGMVMVIDPEIIKVVLKYVSSEKKLKNRIKINTPAATNVDECTKADTGVGAAMAQVSHAVNGNWALFVKAERVIITVRALGMAIHSFHMFIILQCPCVIVSAMDRRIRESPIRFVIRVINPLFSDRGFW